MPFSHLGPRPSRRQINGWNLSYLQWNSSNFNFQGNERHFHRFPKIILISYWFHIDFSTDFILISYWFQYWFHTDFILSLDKSENLSLGAIVDFLKSDVESTHWSIIKHPILTSATLRHFGIASILFFVHKLVHGLQHQPASEHRSIGAIRLWIIFGDHATTIDT